ncbi:hypothetical protein LVJ94_46370 [Pendulispora rubella]|uniref:Poly-gamma-glutamate synthase PgsB n=1 Tax=Pendulispora rubella TaxID=2741070 RepID=A0ABZ2L6L6_9BACT
MAERRPRPALSGSRDDDVLGPLRRKLAAAEIARVEAVACRGPRALLQHAADLDARAAARREGAIPKSAAQVERTATEVFRLELECEIALVVLRSLGTEADERTLGAIIALALRPGRWSRRVEAFALLRTLAEPELHAELRWSAVKACLDGLLPVQHRWVQVAAAETLAHLDPERARVHVLARFTHALPGDDFLVRARLVELAARLPSRTWGFVLDEAVRDPSEHVRLTAARLQPDPRQLAHTATHASTGKVRTMALVSLAKRGSGQEAQPTLRAALASESYPDAIEAAAEGFTVLARRKVLRNLDQAESSLALAAARTDLPGRTRAAVVEELSAVSVLGDPFLRLVHDLVSDAVVRIPVGSSAVLAHEALEAVTDDQMGRVLSVLARGDFGLCAERLRDGFLVHRGEVRSFSAWRWLFELLHPMPSKRQGYSHTWARRLRGNVRAPPQGLAELSPTQVPGERLLVGKRGDWGRHLPLVDDLLHAGIFAPQPARIVSPLGTTVVTPPRAFHARLAAWARLSMHYARFAAQRHRSLESDEKAVQRGFVDSVRHETGIAIDFIPHPFAARLPRPPELAAMAPIAAWGAFPDGIVRDLLHYAVSAEGNRLPHVGAYAATLLVGMIARAVMARRRIDQDRKAIPLVVGGWGTRGKSGTERLKAGLFQGLGYDVLVKTTGCEAMFIHGIPGLRAQEVFIHRPYDKATIWEQRALLTLARRFGVRVFLWECMALQPDLVNLLQMQWMRDDYSTITNAYPDHEDVQGPAGYDVAQVISEFVPKNGRLFTTEDQMLPLLRESANARGTSVRAVSEREAALIGDDILARFPYHEHPKNMALVVALAQALGVSSSVALAEMADHVVPDLGVLKTYPRAEYAGRSLSFTNGMSANERTAALSNWVRAGFVRDADADPSRWVVTVVNNRADRVARSEVFARFIVEDIAAHKHVIIGTNVSGFLRFTREALNRFLERTAPTRDLEGDEAARYETVEERLRKAWQRLSIGAATTEAVLAELEARSWPDLAPALVSALLTPSGAGESVEQGRRAVEAGMPSGYPADARAFVVDSLARRRATRAVDLAAVAHAIREPARLDAIFAQTYRALFEEQLVAIDEPAIKGDALIARIAQTAPPGARVDIMGLQNIKGTGLDFVYRWVSLDTVARALDKVGSPSPEAWDEGLRELLTYEGWGHVEASHALAVLESHRAHVPPDRAVRIDAVLTYLRPIEEQRRRALTAKASRSLRERLRDFTGRTFDYLDAMRRQRMAKRVLDDLVTQRISHAEAALAMRAIVARGKMGQA